MKQVSTASVILGIILCAASGCSRRDPVADLKRAMKVFAAKSDATSYSFDVTKTDSLVTPLLGTVKYIYSGEHKDDPAKRTPDDQMTVTFAYQGKEWIVKKICREVDLRDSILPERLLYCDDDDKNKGSFRLPEDRLQWERALSS